MCTQKFLGVSYLAIGTLIYILIGVAFFPRKLPMFHKASYLLGLYIRKKTGKLVLEPTLKRR